ncbi:hypothetical protein Hanom_Chr13g01216561 [Helianthus anomalus]
MLTFVSAKIRVKRPLVRFVDISLGTRADIQMSILNDITPPPSLCIYNGGHKNFFLGVRTKGSTIFSRGAIRFFALKIHHNLFSNQHGSAPTFNAERIQELANSYMDQLDKDKCAWSRRPISNNKRCLNGSYHVTRIRQFQSQQF